MSQDRLRVALLTLYPVEAGRILGGVRAVAYNLVQGLKRYPDLELHVVHCHADIGHDTVAEEPPSGGAPVTIHYLAMPRQRLLPNMTGSIRRVRRCLSEIAPDVVHAHIGYYALAALGAGYPTAYTIHGVAHEEAKAYRRRLFDRLRYGLYAYYDGLAVRRATDLVAISDYVREAYQGRTRARWHRINNPVTEDFFQAGQAEDPALVLYVGSITEVKDLLTLLRAMQRVHARLPAARLELAGRVTSAAYEAQLQQVVRDQGMGGYVRFLGLLERSELLRKYAESAVVALSSRQENAPMTVIEAMAMGRPVVSTRVGGVAGLMVEGETGFLVPVGDDEALAERILALLGDSARRAEMGQRARERALALFSVQGVARQYHDLYCELAGRLPLARQRVEEALP